MQILESIFQKRILPLFLSVSIIIDYTLTFYFADSIKEILENEFSPILLFAIENNVVIPYFIVIVFFYYGISYSVLKALEGTKLYYFGASIILLMSITHFLGGMSWYIRETYYSNAIFTLSMVSILFALGLFGYEIIRID
ncbi:MAG: hypothetical protein ACLFMM_02095 [Methanohalobium sp.]